MALKQSSNRHRLLFLITCILCLICVTAIVTYYFRRASRTLYTSHHGDVERRRDNDARTEHHTPSWQAWIINMDKNEYRMQEFQKSYQASDFSNNNITVHRFSAVVGAEIDPSSCLSDGALTEFIETEKRGYRTKHYQLSRGAIGCFLSHYYLMKKLVDTPSCDMFLMLEDDIILPADCYAQIQDVLRSAPQHHDGDGGWDIILLGYHRVRCGDDNELVRYDRAKFQRVIGFWGMFGYIITKQGAQKFVEQVETTYKIDAQIDAFMSYLANKDILKIYAVTHQVISGNYELGTSDVQMHFNGNGDNDDGMVYRGFLV